MGTDENGIGIIEVQIVLKKASDYSLTTNNALMYCSTVSHKHLGAHF